MNRRLPLECPQDLLPEARAQVAGQRRARLAGLPRAVASWPPSWREAFEERAALMEFHGGLPTERAEQLAQELLRAAFDAGASPA